MRTPNIEDVNFHALVLYNKRYNNVAYRLIILLWMVLLKTEAIEKRLNMVCSTIEGGEGTSIPVLVLVGKNPIFGNGPSPALPESSLKIVPFLTE